MQAAVALFRVEKCIGFMATLSEQSMQTSIQRLPQCLAS